MTTTKFKKGEVVICKQAPAPGRYGDDDVVEGEKYVISAVTYAHGQLYYNIKGWHDDTNGHWTGFEKYFRRASSLKDLMEDVI